MNYLKRNDNMLRRMWIAICWILVGYFSYAVGYGYTDWKVGMFALAVFFKEAIEASWEEVYGE